MSVVGRRKSRVLFLLILGCAGAWAEDFASLCADRTAIERVYFNHRTGTKPPFEEVLPRATLEDLVRQDLKKQSVLGERYGVAITPAMLDAEVQRITTTTRAPEMLHEIKAALDNSPARFAEAFAKPFLVERLLRDKFDNDDTLHAAQRRECESVRSALLTTRSNGLSPAQLLSQLKQAHSNAVVELSWELQSRPSETNALTGDELEIKKRFGPDAKLLSSPQDGERKLYFEELPPGLQEVLRVQLRQPGDISAVIETPGGFLLYMAKERTDVVLSVASLSLPKRSHEQWLEEQKENQP